MEDYPARWTFVLVIACWTWAASSGWVTWLLARLVTDGPEGFGRVVGVDVSDEMIRRASAPCRKSSKTSSRVGIGVRSISVGRELLRQDAVRRIVRLLSRSGSRAGRVVPSYGATRALVYSHQLAAKPRPHSLQWVDKLKVPVHVRSEAEYIELLKKHGFENAEARRIPDDTPTPDDYQTKSFHSLEDFGIQAASVGLLLMVSKPGCSDHDYPARLSLGARVAAAAMGRKA